MYNLEFSIFKVSSGIEKEKQQKKEKPFCVSEKKKEPMQSEKRGTA